MQQQFLNMSMSKANQSQLNDSFGGPQSETGPRGRAQQEFRASRVGHDNDDDEDIGIQDDNDSESFMYKEPMPQHRRLDQSGEFRARQVQVQGPRQE